MSFKAIKLTILTLFISSCASIAQNPRVTLEQLDDINWQSINKSNADQVFGKPDMKSFVSDEKNEEVWIYLGGNPKNTKLSLIFTESTGMLQSANWFFRQSDDQAKLSTLMSHYGESNYKKSVSGEAPKAPKLDIYKHQKSGPDILVFSKSGIASSLSWEITASTSTLKRSPTSH